MKSCVYFFILAVVVAPVAFAQPQLTAPAADADIWDTGPGKTLRFSWNPVSGAAKYRLCMTGAANLTCSPSVSTTKVFTVTATFVDVPLTDFSNEFLAKWLQWGVQALNASDGILSTSQVRQVWLRYRPAPLVSPAHNATATTLQPTFTWTAVPGAEAYKVVISSITDPWGARETYEAGTSTSLTAPSPIPSIGSTGVYWSVVVCKPAASCSFNGKVSDGTQRYLKYQAPDPIVSFAEHLYPMITTSCSGCHQGTVNYPQNTAGRVDNTSTRCNEGQTIPFNSSVSPSEMYDRFRCLTAMSRQGTYAEALGKVYVVPNQPKISGLYWKALRSDAGTFGENKVINGVQHTVREWIKIWIDQGARP
jgi:hypothetical protein